MPKVWILRGVKKGILTSGFPKAKPTAEEIPQTSAPPTATDRSDWAEGERLCPTGAIKDGRATERAVDLGRCVYCRRCTGAGFEFAGPEVRGTAALQASVKSGLEARRRGFRRSLHILMIDVGSCNACNLEVLNLSNPYYDLTRLGIFFTNSPKHADALVVVGALNAAMVDALKRTYESMPGPKFVISVGACAISGGVFQKTEGFVSPVGDAVPVDVVIPGCPPTPIQVLEGLLLAMGRLEKRPAAREVASQP